MWPLSLELTDYYGIDVKAYGPLLPVFPLFLSCFQVLISQIDSSFMFHLARAISASRSHALKLVAPVIAPSDLALFDCLQCWFAAFPGRVSVVMCDCWNWVRTFLSVWELNKCDRVQQTHSSLEGKGRPVWRTTASMRRGLGPAPGAKQERFWWILSF